MIFFWIIRPFIRFLLTDHQLNKEKKLQEQTLKINSTTDSDVDFPEETIENSSLNQHQEHNRSEKKMTDHEKLSKLAQSDPDKAGKLIQRWINSDN